MINLILMRELKKLMRKYSMQFCKFFLFSRILSYILTKILIKNCAKLIICKQFLVLYKKPFNS